MGERGTKKLNAFNGVFIPTFLSIIGVILFLRLGNIVGETGLLGTLIIIFVSISVVLATGLSLASITTNIKIGDGGAYGIISKTLGLEVGGSVGIPLYLAQASSVALYVFGFAEAWQFIFPEHPQWLVGFILFLFIATVTIISKNIAIKIQTIVFLLVLLSLGSIFAGGTMDITQDFTEEVTVLANSDFWVFFALFFPATTGLMAGIGLSGSLQDPKKQIPRGVLWAIGVSTAIYAFMAVWLASTAQYAELQENMLVMVDYALEPNLVLIGILAATFSSALTATIATPTLLATMADSRVLPFAGFLSKRNNGEPRIAGVVTAAFIIFLLFTANLDAIAPFLTVFFLLTYAMINIVVYIEQKLGSVSFRPTLPVSNWVPLYGAISSVLIIILISPIAGILSLSLLIITYNALLHKQLKQNHGDVRSGIFRNVAEWATRKVIDLPESTQHTWKPNVLLPVITTRTVLGNYPLIRAITTPNGTMNVLGLEVKQEESNPKSQAKAIKKDLDELPKVLHKFTGEDIFTSSTKVHADTYADGISISLEAMESQVFHPNILFLTFKPQDIPIQELKRIYKTAKQCNVGIQLLDKDQEIGLGTEEDVHVWIDDDVIGQGLDQDHPYDLAMITAYRLYTNWHGNLIIHMSTTNEKQKDAKRYLKRLLYDARFPESTKIDISTQSKATHMKNTENGDIHIVATQTIEEVINTEYDTDSKTILYVTDSQKENILG